MKRIFSLFKKWNPSTIKNWSPTLRLKCIASFAGVLAIFLIALSYNVYQVDSIKGKIEIQNGKVALKLQALQLKVLVQDVKDISSGLMISRKQEFAEKYQAKRPEFEKMIRSVADTAETPEQLQWRSQLILTSTDYLNSFDQAIQIIQNKSLDNVAIQKNTEYLYNQAQEQRDKIFTLVDNFYQSYAFQADAAVAASQSQLRRTEIAMWIATAAVIIAGAAISVLLINSFTGPIQRLQTAVSQVAAGDLRNKIKSRAKDELGILSRDFDSMVDQVRAMLIQTQSVASSLFDQSTSFQEVASVTAEANTHIVKAVEEISIGAGQQAEQAERSSHLITDLQIKMNDIWTFTESMRSVSEEAGTNTKLGIESVRNLEESAAQTDQTIKKVNEAIETLAESSSQIGKIVGAITDVSAQTNVLSLNAAIEAARAGIHGKGFSVIAEEVRVLSQQANESSKNAAQIVKTLQNRIAEVENYMSDAYAVLVTQNEKVEQTFQSFDSIEQSMNQVIEQIGYICEQVNEARSKNDELIHAAQQVAAISEETAASVQEVNSSSVQQNASINQIASQANDILQFAQKLFDEINRFQVEAG